MTTSAKARYRAKPESKAKEAEYHRTRMESDPEYVARRRRNTSSYRKRPEARARHVERARRYRADPDNAEKLKLLETRKRCKKYGLTLEQRDELLKSQDGKCAICTVPVMFSGSYSACVDHCHSTKKVRGILCAPCNLALGKMKDCPDRLRRAAEYLERNK